MARLRSALRGVCSQAVTSHERSAGRPGSGRGEWVIVGVSACFLACIGHISLLSMIRILRLWPKLASIGLLTLSHCSLMNLASLDEAQTVGAIQDNDGGIGSAEFGHDASVGAAVGFVQASDGSAVTADCAPPGAGDLTSTMLSDGAPEDASEGSARDAVAETSISDGGRPEVGPADASTGVSEGGGIGPADAALDALGWCDAAKPFGAPVLMTSLE